MSGSNTAPRQREMRREARRPAVHSVEYSSFPRRNPRQRPTETVSVNRSPSGLCINAHAWEAEGTVLRVVVRDISGRPALDALARVAWCSKVAGERYRIGLALLAEGRREPGGAAPQIRI